jgi:hypothetical protein
MIRLTGARDSKTLYISPIQIVAVFETPEHTVIDTTRLSYLVRESPTYINELISGFVTCDESAKLHPAFRPSKSLHPEITAVDIRQSIPTSLPTNRPTLRKPPQRKQ